MDEGIECKLSGGRAGGDDERQHRRAEQVKRERCEQRRCGDSSQHCLQHPLLGDALAYLRSDTSAEEGAKPSEDEQAAAE